jgi:hypothetical protein
VILSIKADCSPHRFQRSPDRLAAVIDRKIEELADLKKELLEMRCAARTHCNRAAMPQFECAAPPRWRT